LIGPGLAILFCGINPSLYSACVGHHFARPGNRFYKTLARAGFTDGVLDPSNDETLLSLGYGITNLVARATASADELSNDEFVRGARTLAKKLRRFHPRALAFLGIDSYRVASGNRHARVGKQLERFAEIPTWVLPNPSGLNAHYQLDDLARIYRRLRLASARQP
jgi:TDG/mug DNA glycosylase family protein